MNESMTYENSIGGGAESGPSTGDRRRRAAALALGILCALLIGCASSTATPTAKVSPSASHSASLTPTPTTKPTPTPTAKPTAKPTTAKPTAKPTAGTIPIARVTFNNMELDALGDPNHHSRTFTFQTDGKGPVSVEVVKSKGGATRLCLSADGGTASCHYGKTPGFPLATATTAHSTWTVQVISAGNATTPIVDVAMSWPTYNPKITLTHGRLQGSTTTGVPDELNGFSVTFKPLGAGNLAVSAHWTTIITDIDVMLANVSSSPSVNLNEKQYKGVGKISPAYTHAVDQSKTYRFSLRNLDADNYRPDLTADISFP